MTRRRSSSPARREAQPLQRSPLPPVWGEYVPHAHVSAKNIGNAVLTAVVLLPSFFCVAYLYTTCSATRPVGSACELAIDRPILFANVLFFANVTVAFWLIGLAQRSFWLIDPYWTLLPPEAKATKLPPEAEAWEGTWHGIFISHIPESYGVFLVSWERRPSWHTIP